MPTETHPVCNRCPFANAVLAEANRISPRRRRTSDGVCSGDPAHWNDPTSDHNPSGPNHYAHAVDISQSDANFPARDVSGRVVPDSGFDAIGFGKRKAQDWIDGHGDKRIKYMVANFGGADMIFNPSVSLTWRQNGEFKTDHKNHLHVSFTVAAEQSTAAFFEATGAGILHGDVNDEETFMVVQPNKPASLPGRVCVARLNVAEKVVELFNGAAIKFDEPTADPHVRRWKIGARSGVANPSLLGTPVGMAALPNGDGVVVVMSDHGTFIGNWS